jgi:hypothetical protein
VTFEAATSATADSTVKILRFIMFSWRIVFRYDR